MGGKRDSCKENPRRLPHINKCQYDKLITIDKICCKFVTSICKKLPETIQIGKSIKTTNYYYKLRDFRI